MNCDCKVTIFSETSFVNSEIIRIFAVRKINLTFATNPKS